MTPRDRRRLQQAVEAACELAYRRGFVHGFVACRNQPDLTLHGTRDDQG